MDRLVVNLLFPIPHRPFSPGMNSPTLSNYKHSPPPSSLNHPHDFSDSHTKTLRCLKIPTMFENQKMVDILHVRRHQWRKKTHPILQNVSFSCSFPRYQDYISSLPIYGTILKSTEFWKTNLLSPLPSVTKCCDEVLRICWLLIDPLISPFY